MIQSAVYLGYLVLNSSYFCRLSHEVFVKLSKPQFFHFFLHGAEHEIQISYSCQICILSYIYSSYSLELGEDIQLFCVVQDFCLVTVTAQLSLVKVSTQAEWWWWFSNSDSTCMYLLWSSCQIWPNTHCADLENVKPQHSTGPCV